ncbi:MAG: UbiA family prenyltransferase [Bacteroidota bacterium]
MALISRSTWLHLRIPFSFFLMPVFCFAASQVEGLAWWDYVLVGLILHAFLYPASNGYNSYFDKDEDSIGGLEKPPQVTKDLYFVSLLFDLIALLLGLYYGWQFVAMLFIYGLASKAYSHPAVRMKRYPITGWLWVGFFQGAFTYYMVYAGLSGLPLNSLSGPEVYLPAALSSVLLLGSYPMTQIYQHWEDAKRGDLTLSALLRVRGTFIFTAIVFGLATLGFWYFFNRFYHAGYFWRFLVFLLPVFGYFGYWFLRVLRDPKKADFRHTMRLNLISSLAMILYFTLITLVTF